MSSFEPFHKKISHKHRHCLSMVVYADATAQSRAYFSAGFSPTLKSYLRLGVVATRYGEVTSNDVECGEQGKDDSGFSKQTLVIST